MSTRPLRVARAIAVAAWSATILTLCGQAAPPRQRIGAAAQEVHLASPPKMRYVWGSSRAFVWLP